MKDAEVVEFKGTKNGLVINIKGEHDFDTIEKSVTEKVEGAGGFFTGATIAAINCSHIDDVEYLRLKALVTEKLHMKLLEDQEQKSSGVFEGIQEGDTKFVKSTLRSGKKIEFNGNIVIIGDVNPGAQIVAHGNVVVVGSLKGVVHAGANGNKKAFVSAYELQPMQLRIADSIAIPPESESGNKPEFPEIAFIKDNHIVIEPSLNRK